MVVRPELLGGGGGRWRGCRGFRGGSRGSGGRCGGSRPRGGRHDLGEEAVPAEAGVALPSLGIEDPERRPAPRRPDPALRDERLRPLPDDVPAEPDPGPALQLQPDAARLRDRRRHGRREVRRLEHHKRDPRPPGHRRQPAEPVRDAGHRRDPGGQVDDEEVDRPGRQEGTREREALGGRLGRQDDEPLRPDAARDGLDRVERTSKVQPGHDRPRRLRLSDEPQRERGPPAREVAPERETRPARQATRPEHGVECREPGREDLGTVDLEGSLGLLLRRRRHRREGAHDVAVVARGAARRTARRGRSPPRAEGGEGGLDVGGEGRHAVKYRTNVRMNQGVRQAFLPSVTHANTGSGPEAAMTSHGPGTGSDRPSFLPDVHQAIPMAGLGVSFMVECSPA